LFEKLWIYDQCVARSELTAPFTKLLTLEARLVRAHQRQRVTGPDQSTGSEASATLHGSCSNLLLDVMADGRERPYIEQPHGLLAIDEKNPRPHRGRGSNIHNLVGRTGLEPVTSSV
jgi:hypothetical protein